MNARQKEEEALKRAIAILSEHKVPAAEAARLLEGIDRKSPLHRQAMHVRGIVAFRQGNPEESVGMLVEAIRLGEFTTHALANLAKATAAAGYPQEPLDLFVDCIKRHSVDAQLPALTRLIADGLDFNQKAPLQKKKPVFEHFLVPLLEHACEKLKLDYAIAIERLVYHCFVKSEETEEHFAWCMKRISPPLERAGKRIRNTLPALPDISLSGPLRIGFFIDNATTLAHIEMLINTLKGYQRLDEQPFEPTVYCFDGRNEAMEQAFAGIGVRLVMLADRIPGTGSSHWQRLLGFRRILAEDGVQELVWVSLVIMMPLAFSIRIAPVQTWLAMKYRNYTLDSIDGYLTGSALSRFGHLAGRKWRMMMLGVDDWHDPSLAPQALKIRGEIKEPTVLMTLARTEKMLDDRFLSSITTVLRQHPETIFLWAGREEHSRVTAAFEAAGVRDRTRFIGWVDTRLYVQVADIFLDTYPFPCGVTLFQAMAAGKPVVLFDSPESAQTGLWNFIKPLTDGNEGTPGERAELAAFIGPAERPLLPVARSPSDYVAMASRLVTDIELRRDAGESARRMVAHYFSDPRRMGRSLASHLVELIEEKRTAHNPEARS